MLFTNANQTPHIIKIPSNEKTHTINCFFFFLFFFMFLIISKETLSSLSISKSPSSTVIHCLAIELKALADKLSSSLMASFVALVLSTDLIDSGLSLVTRFSHEPESKEVFFSPLFSSPEPIPKSSSEKLTLKSFSHIRIIII